MQLAANSSLRFCGVAVHVIPNVHVLKKAVLLFVPVPSGHGVQRAEPRHHHRRGGRGGDHHPRLHGVWLHHWEKVRSRGPH